MNGEIDRLQCQGRLRFPQIFSHCRIYMQNLSLPPEYLWMTQESAAGHSCIVLPLSVWWSIYCALCCKLILVQRLIPDESQQFTIRPSGTLTWPQLTIISYIFRTYRSALCAVEMHFIMCSEYKSAESVYYILQKENHSRYNLGFSNWTQSQFAIQIDNRIICFTFPLARNFIIFEITYFPTASLYRIKINWKAPSSTSSPTHYHSRLNSYHLLASKSISNIVAGIQLKPFNSILPLLLISPGTIPISPLSVQTYNPDRHVFSGCWPTT